MASNKAKCPACSKIIESSQYLKCHLCRKKYDLFCANISEQRFQNSMTSQQKLIWKCMLCISKEPRTSVTITPARSLVEGVTSRRGAAAQSPRERTPEECFYSANQDMSDIQLLIKEVRLFREEMSATRSQIEILNTNISKLSVRIDNCDGRIDQLNTRIDVLEQRVDVGAGVEQGDKSLYESIEKLKFELNERDQELLLNDIEISCIPEVKNENLTHAVMTLASKVGMSLSEQDVVSAARVGRLMPQNDGSLQTSQPSRPRIIIVRLARRVIRDKFLQSARVRRGATTEDTDLPGPPRRFYINERLTKLNRSLFQRAREIGQRLNWRFIWTKAGKIYVRQHSGTNAPRMRLRSETDIVRVFGQENICS